MGMVRVDSAGACEIGNVVACRSQCNWVKGAFPRDGFVARMADVAVRHPKETWRRGRFHPCGHTSTGFADRRNATHLTSHREESSTRVCMHMDMSCVHAPAVRDRAEPRRNSAETLRADLSGRPPVTSRCRARPRPLLGQKRGGGRGRKGRCSNPQPRSAVKARAGWHDCRGRARHACARAASAWASLLGRASPLSRLFFSLSSRLFYSLSSSLDSSSASSSHSIKASEAFRTALAASGATPRAAAAPGLACQALRTCSETTSAS